MVYVQFLTKREKLSILLSFEIILFHSNSKLGMYSKFSDARTGGGATIPPTFSRLFNPIPTRGGQIIPPKY